MTRTFDRIAVMSPAALRLALAALALSLSACGDKPQLRGSWFQTSRADPQGSAPPAVEEPLRIVLQNEGVREVSIYEASLSPPPGKRAAMSNLSAVADLRESGIPRLRPGQFLMLVIEPSDVPALARDGCYLPARLFVRTEPQKKPREVPLGALPANLTDSTLDCPDAEVGSQPSQ